MTDAGSIHWVVADVTVEEQVAAAAAAAREPTGQLDILFANAGGSFHMGPFAEADVEAIRATVDLNLVGTALCIKHAVPAMRDGRRRLDHRHVLGRRALPAPLPVGLRRGQGRHRHAVPQRGRGARRGRHPGEHGAARASSTTS